MRKMYKLISLSLVFIVTLLTCSACLEVGNEGTSQVGNVELVTTDSSTTIRFMNEAIYLGYLGAQRDFALIVDNADYRLNKGECGTGEVGCASILTKMVINYGIKAALTMSDGLNDKAVGTAENLLMYYTSANDFITYGDLAPEESWFTKLVGKTVGYADNYGDPLRKLSCGYKGEEHPDACEYAKDMANEGTSKKAGDSMILLFHNSELAYVITDNDLDKNGHLNDSSGKDNLRLNSDISFYYDNLIRELKTKVITTQLGVNKSNSGTSKQDITEISSLSGLRDLISKNNEDFILLITTDGFMQEKVGTNKDIDGKVVSDSTSGEMNEEQEEEMKAMLLLLNSVSAFTDNCAVESEPVLNFLKSLLQKFLAGTIGALGGAAIGAGAGALIGSIIPGVGTAIGAGVGAIAGAIIGWFAGMKVNDELENMMLEANGISDTNFCQVMGSALKNVEINVPIYIYSIDSAKDNINDYQNNTLSDSELREYYSANNSCLKQATEIFVPSGLMSFFSDALDKGYKYADSCEVNLVSNIVGGFGGSPSLLLYRTGNNGSPVKADDLYGRVTTELIMEMMSVWGLKSIADVYTMALNSKINNVSFEFGSVQEIKNAKYCVSSKSVAEYCDISEYQNLNLNSTYKNAISQGNGISVDVTGIYKQYSATKTAEMFSSVSNINITGSHSNANYQYRDKVSTTWESKVAYPTTGDEEVDSNRVLTDDLISLINSKILSTISKGGAYQIKYNGNYYILDDDNNVIVSYNMSGDNVYNILYLHDPETDQEYLFTGDYKGELDEFVSSILTTDKNMTDVNISSAHEFYVSMSYQRTIADEDGGYPIQYYTFTF